MREKSPTGVSSSVYPSHLRMEHLVLLAKPETKSVPALARVPPIAREETSLVPLVSKKLGREKSLAAPKEQVPVRRIRVALLEWWPLVSSHDSHGRCTWEGIPLGGAYHAPAVSLGDTSSQFYPRPRMLLKLRGPASEATGGEDEE